MLRQVKRTRLPRVTGRFAIVASKYNPRFVDSMVACALKTLRSANSRQEVTVVRVPGAYEIPLIVAELAEGDLPPPLAILCLGVIIRGQTAHAQLIAEAVTDALMLIQTRARVPVVHEVLLVEDERQAKARCLDPKHNRGGEAAQTALQMAAVLRDLRRGGGTAAF